MKNQLTVLPEGDIIETERTELVDYETVTIEMISPNS